MHSNDEMVRFLVQTSVLYTSSLVAAFSKVDRKDFVLAENKADPYVDYPLQIGHGQTISQPWTVAFMLELLQPEPGDKVLDVGSGSGWTTGLLSAAVGPKGCVYGLEIVPELVTFGKKNLKKYGFKQAAIEQATELGLSEHAPYDRILVSAAAEKLPQALVGQLKPGGRMVIPIKSSVWLIEKTATGLVEKQYPGFAFVPLRTDDD